MKKNVKKVTIGVLSCSLLLTMSACTKKRSAEEVKLTKKDGNNVVAYSIDGKELGKYLKQKSNKNSKGTSNSTLSLDDVNIKSMKGSRTLNDKDLPLKESITLVVENKKKSKTDNNMFSGLTNGKTTVKINVTYKNPGKSVSVTLPKDLSSYKLQKK